jgi:23S rRNA pseudouridine2605 synthase/16S rRNA pseudouridine516 synthase
MTAEDAETAVRAGRVQVAGRTFREPMTFVRPGDEVRVDGRAVSLEAPTIVLMFHKPAGVVTSSTDPEGNGTVFDRLLAVLPPELQRYGWHAVGRLDRDTTGLLLFTNDEKVVGHITSPETHLPKRYVAAVGSKADDAKLEPLRRGIQLHDGVARPAKARVLEDGRVELTITEGRHHQVKRMLGEVGLPVTKLHRAAIGDLELDVPEGQWRRLTNEELSSSLRFSLAGK